MEYYGKILCISKNDLTRDDRPVQLANGNLDYSQSREINGVHPSMWSLEVLAPIMSSSCYDQLAYRKKILVVRKGIGRGVSALVSVESLPEKYKKRVEEKYGDMDTEALRNQKPYGTGLARTGRLTRRHAVGTPSTGCLPGNPSRRNSNRSTR